MRNLLLVIFSFLSIISIAQKPNNVGVLLLAHGGTKEWNKMVENAAEAVSKEYTTEVAFGMANPYTMQTAISSLEERGVKKIIVVQLFISSYSFIPRQNEYLLGLREKMTQPPILMQHGQNSGGHISEQHIMKDPWANPSSSFPRIEHNSEIVLTEPLNDHDLVAEILLENANELSRSKETEVLILVGHGPINEDDNTNWVKTMESLSKKIHNMSGKAKSFKMIFSLTVRDDAEEQIYEQAKENLRQVVRQSSFNNTVIVVPLLLSRGGVEADIVKRLEGLDYEWTGKTLLPNVKISEFIVSSVAKALE